VLENAKLDETVEEATADCQHVFATTVRKRGVTKPVVSPEQPAQKIHSQKRKSANLLDPKSIRLNSRH